MSHDEERDLDLEERLRHIAEDPQPPVPLSVYRYSVTVTEQRDQKVTTRGAVIRYSRRSFSGLLGVAGVAAAIVIAFGAVALATTFRQSQTAGGPSSSVRPTPAPTSSLQAWSEIAFTKLQQSPFASAPQFVSAATVGGRTLIAGTVIADGNTRATAAISSEGSTWTQVPADALVASSPIQQLRAASCRGGYLLVGVAGKTVGFYSTDGRSWQSSQIGSPWPLSAQQNAIGTTSAGAVVVTGSGLYFASDCTTWRKVTLPAVGGSEVIPIVASALHDTFVVEGTIAGSSQAVTFTSRDGSTWTKALAAAPSLIEMWTARDGLLGSEEGNGGSGFHTTRDGKTWQNLTQPQLLPSYGSLASDGTRIVLWKEQNTMLVTTDATTWIPASLTGAVPLTAAGDGTIQQVAVLHDGLLVFKGADAFLGRAGGGASVAATQTPAAPASTAPVPTNTPLPASVPPTTQPSSLPPDVVTDGADPGAQWTAIDFASIDSAAFAGRVGTTAVRWAHGWVESDLAADGKTNIAWLSQDARTWHAGIVPGVVYPSAAGLTAFDQTMSQAWTSADGDSWAKVSVVGLPSVTDYGVQVVGSSKGIMAALPTGSGETTIYFSAEGAQWRQLATTSPLYIAHAAWTGSGFVVYGQDRVGPGSQLVILYSADGATWAPTGFPGVETSDCSVFVANRGMLMSCATGSGSGASGTVWLTSANGDTWMKSADFSPLAAAGSNPAGMVEGNGDRIVALSSDGKLWSTADAQTWTRLTAKVVQVPTSMAAPPFYITPRGIYYADNSGNAFYGKSR